MSGEVLAIVCFIVAKMSISCHDNGIEIQDNRALYLYPSSLAKKRDNDACRAHADATVCRGLAIF